MKTKKTKKLQLSRITISNLAVKEQNHVKAGYISYSCEGMPGCENTEGCTTGCPSIKRQYCTGETINIRECTGMTIDHTDCPSLFC